MSSFLWLGVWDEKRASDDDIIVNVCWELGDPIVYRSIGLDDGGAKKKQRPRVQVHGGSPWQKRQAVPAPFYTSWVSIGTETLRAEMDYRHPASWTASPRVSEDFQKNVRIRFSVKQIFGRTMSWCPSRGIPSISGLEFGHNTMGHRRRFCRVPIYLSLSISIYYYIYKRRMTSILLI